MTKSIAAITLVVREYDEAIAYYTRSLGFVLLEDTPMENGKRRVVIGPSNSTGAHLLLAKAVNPEQESRIGNQTGGRVFLFLRTDDFYRDYHDMKTLSVDFIEEPRREEYGLVVVFKDLYGNKWDLVGSSLTESQ
jgi:catechol 2,3-dioxygenase-like lactoylglutathione lyase family enzyme